MAHISLTPSGPLLQSTAEAIDEYARKLISEHSLEVSQLPSALLLRVPPLLLLPRILLLHSASNVELSALFLHTILRSCGVPRRACVHPLAPNHVLVPFHCVPQDNFYIVDLGALQRLYRAWGEAMPRVHPYYAVSLVHASSVWF